MKVLRIEGENLASLYGPFCVDFTSAPLASTGVFAISGPTGSGKSTLLDAMCLALYGRTPRLRGVRKGDLMIGEFSATEARSMLSRGYTHGFASVSFESAQGVFRAEWRVDKAKRALKDKTTKEASQKLFQVAPDGILSEIDLRNRSIGEFVGLDYEQFTKTVLLAQGEFRKFLDSTGDERSILLEKLTNTSVFATLGRAAFERAKNERDKLERLRTQVKDIEVLTPEIRALRQMEHDTLLKTVQELRAQGESARKAILWYGKSEQLQTSLETQLAHLVRAQAERETLKLQAQDLNDWEHAQPLRLATEDWRRTKREVKKSEEDLTVLQNAFDASGLNLGHCQIAHTSLLKDLGDFAEYRIEQEALIATVATLEAQWKPFHEAFQRAQQQRSQAHQLLRECRFEQKRSRSRLQTTRTQLSILRTWLSENPGDPQLQIHTFRVEQERALASIEGLEVYLRQRRSLEVSPGEESSFTPEQKRLLEHLREGLQPGMPCVLCGALEHPVTLPDPHQEISRLRGLVQECEMQITLANTQVRELAEKRQQLAQLEGGLAPLESVQEAHRQSVREAWERLDSLRKIHKDASQQFHACSNTLQQLAGGRSTRDFRADLHASERGLKEREQAVNQRLHDSVVQHSTAKASLESLRVRNQDLTQQMQTQQAALQMLCIGLGFENARAHTLLALTPEWAQQTRQRIDTAEQESIRLQGSIDNQHQQIVLHAQDAPTRDKDYYTQLLSEQEPNLLSADQKERQLSALLQKDFDNLQKSGELQEQIQLQELRTARWNTLDGLIGQSNGDLFRRFAQNITLRKLVVSANRHLLRLHRRYQLKPWNNMELVILDLDMGGEMRSTRSLSGGEGFLISMALALGLSDMASKDTRIGSLFIDEGFGTLDSETLQAVVSVLEELRLQGRMVGIISHVDGLAKQLGAVVQIKPIGDGRSQVRVMAAADLED